MELTSIHASKYIMFVWDIRFNLQQLKYLLLIAKPPSVMQTSDMLSVLEVPYVHYYMKFALSYFSVETPLKK